MRACSTVICGQAPNLIRSGLPFDFLDRIEDLAGAGEDRDGKPGLPRVVHVPTFSRWGTGSTNGWQIREGLLICQRNTLAGFIEPAERPTVAESIHLTDGSVVELDRHHWTGLASQESHSLTAGGRYVTPRLAALRHSDGRVVVYATVKDGNKMSAAGGELLPTQDLKPITAALRRLAGQFSMGPFLLERCLWQIDSKPIM